ncbi:Pentatricopeptide repeat-containing protein family [Rhynchospora pubera]|uniref:Pentatricopeptide repeat-containing protein family n=1 Tax=Rhynchospora pubera TaxID=906938 RepID=A0AAV8FJX2_9POAL|nr:Pentatricopeptide repeat-containing protein family [Rhynchospora pubera]
MGKLPPSMRSAKLPLSLLKSSPSPSSSSSSSVHRLWTQKPKPKPKPKPKTSNPNLSTPNPFSSPCLSSAISTSTSLLSLPSPPSPNSLLQSFCLAGASSSDAISFLNHLSTSTSFAPDKSTFHHLLAHSCLSSSPDISPILKVFDLMSKCDHPPDAPSLDLSVRALCASPKSPRLDDACSLIMKSPVKPDEFTYNFLIRRLARDRSVSSVNYFIEQVRSKLSVHPNLVTYTILIDAVCRTGNLREATRLLTVLSDNGFKPDAYVYNTIMKGHCMLDDCAGVMDVYNKMKDEGVEPDLVTYNTLLFGLSKAGMMPQAKRILKAMAESGHFPDVVTYTSLMNGMCRRGEAMEARALLTVMEDKGCTPNECTYNTLVMGSGGSSKNI